MSADLTVAKLNIDDNPMAPSKYGVRGIPTLILFKDGEIAKKVIGAMPKARLEAELEPAPSHRHAPPSAGRCRTRA